MSPVAYPAFFMSCGSERPVAGRPMSRPVPGVEALVSSGRSRRTRCWTPDQERGPRGRANRSVRIELCQPDAVAREPIEIRRPDVWRAVAAEVAISKIVGDDDDDVWTDRRSGTLTRPIGRGNREQRDGNTNGHGRKAVSLAFHHGDGDLRRILLRVMNAVVGGDARDLVVVVAAGVVGFDRSAGSCCSTLRSAAGDPARNSCSSSAAEASP